MINEISGGGGGDSAAHVRGLRMCILGGGGYLGQSLAKALQKLGHFVTVLDLQFQNFAHIVLDPARLRYIHGSILDASKLHDALHNCDACFHLAGYGMTGGSSLNRQMTFAVNYEGTKAIIAECQRQRVGRLLYASSISVVFRGEEMFNSDESAPYAEKFANPYAESKCLAEKALIAANYASDDAATAAANSSATPSPLATCALRFRGIYGPGELRTTQRTVNLGLNGLIMAKFRKSKSPRTQYSNAENCVNAFLLAEESLRRGVDSPARAQVYNIVDGGAPVDTFGFWEPLIESVGGRLPRLYVPYALVYALAFLFETLYRVWGVEPLFTRFEANLMAMTNTFSIEKARRELNYRPVHNHDLSSTIHFCQQQQIQAKILAPRQAAVAQKSANASPRGARLVDVICALIGAQVFAGGHNNSATAGVVQLTSLYEIRGALANALSAALGNDGWLATGRAKIANLDPRLILLLALAGALTFSSLASLVLAVPLTIFTLDNF